MNAMLILFLHTAAAAVFGAAIFGTYRWIARRSRLAGLIVGAAIILRAGVAASMFFVSWYGLPIARSMQAGGGFWEVALDATGYYLYASQAALLHVVVPINSEWPAPVLLNVLSFWMRIVGVSQAAAAMLHLLAYVGFMAALVACFRPRNERDHDLPLLASLAAYSFAPVVLFHSTQPLKDELSYLCGGAAVLGVFALRPAFVAGHERRPWLVSAGLVLLLATMFLIAGTRWYYAIIMWGALAAMTVVTIAAWRTTRFATSAALGLVLLGGTFWVFSIGAGPYYAVVGARFDALRQPAAGAGKGSILQRGVTALVAIPRDFLNFTKISRVSSQLSAGGSTITVPLREDPKEGLKYELQLAAEQHNSAAYQAELEKQRQLEEMRKRAARERERAAPAPAAPPPAAPAPRKTTPPPAAPVVAPPPVLIDSEQQRLKRPPEIQQTEASTDEAPGLIRPSDLKPAALPPPPPPKPKVVAASPKPVVVETPKAPEPPPPAPEIDPVTGLPIPKIAPQEEAAFRALPTKPSEHALVMLRGLAFLVVPLSVMRAVSDIQVSGGHGLLALVDIDTVFLDVTLLAIGYLFWRRRHLIGDRKPVVFFGIMMAAVTGGLLAYVVTNLGTLWRMRPLVVVPLWLLSLALSKRPADTTP